MTRCFVFGCAAVLVLASGCDSPGLDGIVAMNGCPPGRTCVDSTGLSFAGAGLGDEGILFTRGMPATVVGGRQIVELYRPMGFEPFDEPFEVRTLNPTVARATAVPVGPGPATGGPPEIVLEGLSAGTTTLEIRNMRGALFDAIAVEVRPIASAGLVPTRIVEEPHTRTSYAYFAGGTAYATVALVDSTGARLADESLVWSSPEPLDSYLFFNSWDTKSFVVPDASTLEIVVDSGGGSFTASAPIVRALDRIARVGDTVSSIRALRMPVGGMTQLCYAGIAGERVVLGVAFTFEGSGPIAVGTPPPPPFETACIDVTATAAGTAELRVVAGGFELVETIRVP